MQFLMLSSQIRRCITRRPCSTSAKMSISAYQRFLCLQVQDKVGFMINNLTRDNLDGKADELKKALKPELWPWFCNYMVIRRVAQEANHQNLYMQVIICTAHK